MVLEMKVPVRLSPQASPKRRKPCSACGEIIRTGQRYVYERNSWIDDGGYLGSRSVRRCLRCQIIYAHLAERMNAQAHDLEAPDMRLDCGHSYRDVWGEDAPEWLARLAFMTGEELQELAPEAGTSLRDSWEQKLMVDVAKNLAACGARVEGGE